MRKLLARLLEELGCWLDDRAYRCRIASVRLRRRKRSAQQQADIERLTYNLGDMLADVPLVHSDDPYAQRTKLPEGSWRALCKGKPMDLSPPS